MWMGSIWVRDANSSAMTYQGGTQLHRAVANSCIMGGGATGGVDEERRGSPGSAFGAAKEALVF